MYKLLTITSAAVISLFSFPTANATPLLFTITGTDNFSFTLSSPSTPSGLYIGGFGGIGAPALYFTDVIVEDAPEVVTFYPASSAGGFSVGSLPGDDAGTVLYNFILGSDEQLYGGTTTTPVFAIGSYPLLGGYPSTLIISKPAAAIPEIGTWEMMLAGTGAIGFMIRRRLKKPVFSFDQSRST